MTMLIDAAKAVVARWDSPLWKDLPATADYIADLRQAIERAETVEPVAWLYTLKSNGYQAAAICPPPEHDPDWQSEPLYLHKPDRFASVGKTIPYGWMVSGVPTVMRGALAEEIQKQKAKRIGGGCVAFPIYRDVA